MRTTNHPPPRIPNLRPDQAPLFNFLLQNNIQFRKDKENFIAEIILTTKPNNQSITPSKSQKNPSFKAHKSKLSQKSLMTPNKSIQSSQLNEKLSSVRCCTNQTNRNRTKSAKSPSKIKMETQSKQQKIKKSIQVCQFSPNGDRSIKQSNISLNKKTKEEKIFHEKINGYLKLFSIKLQGEKVIKWSLHQLLETIHSIYDEASLSAKKMRKANPSKIVINSIKQYFSIKFKTQKSINSHLITMLNSLTILQSKIQIQNSLKKSPIELQMFINFITQVYHGQDFLFFLSARLKMKKYFRLKQLNSQFTLNRNQIQFFLTILFQKNKDFIQLDRGMIMEHIQSSTMQLSSLFKFLVECYHNKEQFGVKSELETSKKNDEILIHKPVEKESCDRKKDSFWQCCVKQIQFDDSTEMLVAQKLKKKARQLVEIILCKDNQNSYNSYNQEVQKVEISKVQNLLIRKSLVLLATILVMNKVKWFRELRITEPGPQEMEIVERLQLNLREIKENPQAKAIGQFCKTILTVDQLKQALEELII